MRFGRNLTASEILDQVLHFRRQDDLNHLVFMGMGEPLMNVDSVLAAAERLPDTGITNRRTGVSTIGWIPGIERLTACPLPLRLALSLHAADESLRSEIMPVNDRYPLSEVLEACRAFYERKRRQVFVEYVMLAGVNDRYEQAVALAERLDPKVYKVNLIPYNPTDAPYEGSSRAAIDAFRDALEEHGLRATVRLTRGRDIDAACGQLAARTPLRLAPPWTRPGRGAESRTPARASLVLGALGVVFGDIGTSPIYAMQTVFDPDDRTRSRPPRRTSSGSSRWSSGR